MKLFKRLFAWWLIFLTLLTSFLGYCQAAYASDVPLATGSDYVLDKSVTGQLLPRQMSVSTYAYPALYYETMRYVFNCYGIFMSDEDNRKASDDFAVWLTKEYSDNPYMINELDMIILGPPVQFVNIPIAMSKFISLYEGFQTPTINVGDTDLLFDARSASTNRRLMYNGNYYKWDSNYQFLLSFKSDGVWYEIVVPEIVFKSKWSISMHKDATLCFYYYNDYSKRVEVYPIYGYYTVPLNNKKVFVDVAGLIGISGLVEGAPVFESYEDAQKYIMSDVVIMNGYIASKSSPVRWPALINQEYESITIGKLPTAEEQAEIDTALEGAVTSEEALEIIKDIVTAVKPSENTGGDDWELPAELDGLLDIIKAILSALYGMPAEITNKLVTKLISSLSTSIIGSQLTRIRGLVEDIAGWNIGVVPDVLKDIKATMADWPVTLGQSIEKGLTTIGIPQALADILTGVNAIPGSITDALAGVDAIPGAIADLGEQVQTIPGTLTGLWDDVKAIPGLVATAITDALTVEDTGTEEENRLSSIISDKFPFCIPFDLIDCIKVLESKSIPPRWEIPFIVDLGFASANESVVIDLSTEDWQPLVKIVRGFILLFYIFGLVLLTRNLIKG